MNSYNNQPQQPSYGGPYQQPYPPQSYPQQPYMRPARRTNSVATVGFVFSLIALFLGWIPVVGLILWFVGLICSFVGIFSAPRGLAVAGLIISIATMILGLLTSMALLALYI